MKKLTLKECRKLTPFTQREFAEVIGVSPKTISLWENGRRSPSYEQGYNLMLVLNYLGFEVGLESIEWLKNKQTA